MVTRQLESAFNGLGTGVAVEEAMGSRHGSNRRKPFSQVRERLVVKVGTRNVNEFGGLLLNGGHHFGVTMAGGRDGDAGRKVKEFVAVDILDANAAAAFGDQRIRAGITGRNQAVIGLNRGASLGAWKRCDELWPILSVHFLLGHRRISSLGVCGEPG